MQRSMKKQNIKKGETKTIKNININYNINIDVHKILIVIIALIILLVNSLN